MKKIKAIFCILFGHSRITSVCFGYHYCGRCGNQIGDSLGACYDGSKDVVIGHNCPTCKANYKTLTWKDKFLAPNPFKAETI